MNIITLIIGIIFIVIAFIANNRYIQEAIVRLIVNIILIIIVIWIILHLFGIAPGNVDL